MNKSLSAHPPQRSTVLSAALAYKMAVTATFNLGRIRVRARRLACGALVNVTLCANPALATLNMGKYPASTEDCGQAVEHHYSWRCVVEYTYPGGPADSYE